jgi:hypothetical protein
MSDRSQDDGASSDRASEQPSQLQEIANELCSVGHMDASESLGRRRPMEPLSFYPESSTVGFQVASGLAVLPLATAPSPLEGITVTTIEPRPSLVACTVHFIPAIHGNLMESLSGALRREYPHASASCMPSGREVFFSAPDQSWAVWFTPSAIGLETRHFQEFGEFHDRLGVVMRLLDPGLYKRVGLRSVFRIPSSWTGTPKPLPPNQQHLGRVIQWGSHGGRSYFDLDVFAENIQPAALDAHLTEIFQASQRLAPDAAVSAETVRELSSSGDPDEHGITATEITAYPELVPFDDPRPDVRSEVDLVVDARAELLARKYGGQGLSQDERERLDSLTARLEELLPPVSSQDLEVLVEMAEQAERIRESARERRMRLGLN